MSKKKLRDIAHARAGDKGNVSSIGLYVYDETDYPAVKAQVTPELLKVRYGNLFRGDVQCYAIDHLYALNFVIQDGLEGGVNSSLNLDAHGKSWSYLLLDLEVNS
ncbi:MAG: hypothetical protein AAF639_21715 [Chloroflexota bacterium]